MAAPVFCSQGVTQVESLFGWITQPEAWLAFGTLLLLEVVLGIDNVIFISILAGKLPPEQQQRARTIGLLGAMFMRLGLLFSISWIYSLKNELFEVFGQGFSGRDLILIFGGLFLLYKAVKEMHEQLEGPEHGAGSSGARWSGRTSRRSSGRSCCWTSCSASTVSSRRSGWPTTSA
ncbi:TerC family protein [Deinococcus aquaticus]|uniref:TerC family protein n=1 Tax=Deinococcus aquaticus TaxID=328692 RepID=UPI00362236E6